MIYWVPGGTVVRNPPSSAGDAGFIPASENSLEEEMVTYPSNLAWKILRTGETGGLQSQGCKESGTIQPLSTHEHTIEYYVIINCLKVCTITFSEKSSQGICNLAEEIKTWTCFTVVNMVQCKYSQGQPHWDLSARVLGTVILKQVIPSSMVRGLRWSRQR